MVPISAGWIYLVGVRSEVSLSLRHFRASTASSASEICEARRSSVRKPAAFTLNVKRYRCDALYVWLVIASLAELDTGALYLGKWGKRLNSHSDRKALTQLLLLDDVEGADELRVPPGHRLEA